jgi:hypothetical protein
MRDPATLQVPTAIFAPHWPKKKNAVCETCEKKVRRPHLIYDVTQDHTYRVLHITSRLLKPCGKRIKGLLPLDAIPAGVAIPYPGHLVDEHALALVEKETGIKLTRAYAKGGPSGSKTVLFGHLAKKSAYHCAHYINCTYKTKLTANAQWGRVKVTDKFKAVYSELDTSGGDNYPCVRTTKPIQVGEEILVNSYGSSYWSRNAKEKDDPTVSKIPALLPHFKRKLDQVDDAEQRKDRKRQRVVND